MKQTLRVISHHLYINLAPHPIVQPTQNSVIINNPKRFLDINSPLESIRSFSGVWPVTSPNKLIRNLSGKRLDDWLQVVVNRSIAGHAIEAGDLDGNA